MDDLKTESESAESKKAKDPNWLKMAASQIGVKEITGISHHPQILIYHSTTSLKATEDEVPWCSSFVNWAFISSGIMGTSSALARSWANWGERLDKPKRGCVVVLKRGTKSWQGHVGLLVKEDDDKVMIIGGNQSNAVSTKWYPKSSVIAYRWPLEEDTIYQNQNSSRGSRESV